MQAENSVWGQEGVAFSPVAGVQGLELLAHILAHLGSLLSAAEDPLNEIPVIMVSCGT